MSFFIWLKEWRARIVKTPWQTWCVSIFLLAFLILHLRLVANTFAIDHHGDIHSTFEGYGDIPLHLSQITHFAFEPSLSFDEPIYYGTRLAYPFVINFISGMFLRLTGLWSFSILWPMFFLVVVNVFLIYVIYKRLLSKRFLAYVTLIVFFIGAGVGGYVVTKNALSKSNSPQSFATNLFSNYGSNVLILDAHYPDQNIDTGAPLTLVFIHQRTSIIGLAFMLVFILLVHEIARKEVKRWKILMAGLVLGLMPLVHTHTFVAALVFMFVYALFSLSRDQRYILKRLIFVGIIAAVIATPQMIYLLSDKSALSTTADFARFRVGWMVPATIGSANFPTDYRSAFSLEYLKFLWLNFGFFMPLFLLAACYLIWKFKHEFGVATKSEFDAVISDENSKSKLKDINSHRDISMSREISISREILIYGITSAFLFIIVELVRFQPWDFDDNKLLVYVQLFATPFIICALIKFLQKFRPIWTYVSIVIVAIVTTYSGILNVIPRALQTTDNLPVIFSTDDQFLADFVRALPGDGPVLTPIMHPNPVVSLAGKSIIVGYEGWLWTRGIDYGVRERELKEFYKDPASHLKFLKEFPIKYILFNNMTQTDYGANRATFDHLFDNIFESGQNIIYKLKDAK